MTPAPKPTPKQKKLPKRKCANCRETFQKEKPLQQCCTIRCAIEYSKKLEKKKADREWREEKRIRKEKAKTVGEWRADLQKVVNAIARELDKDRPCISHPEMNDNTYDGGHFWSVGAHGSIRYNLHNIHKQCKRANKEYGGGADYAAGLLNRYGNDYLNMIANLPKKYDMYGKKFTIKNIREEYLPNARKVLRELKAGAEFTRDQINEMIGIYGNT